MRLNDAGRWVFNKGYRHIHPGQSYEQVYGAERSAAIRAKIAQSVHRTMSQPGKMPARHVAVVNVLPDGSIRHFLTIKEAARSVGKTICCIRYRILSGADLDGRWFFASDCHLWKAHLDAIDQLNETKQDESQRRDA